MSYTTKNIRNAVLLGHSGSGKTTLTETMLFESGGIKRMGSVAEGTTKSDYTAIEKERGNSIFSSLLHVYWKDVKINLLDTPGLDDFAGEVISSLKVADTAIMVLNAQNGVEVGTELLWDYIDTFKTPSIFVVNQLDHPKSNFEQTLKQAKERFGNKVVEVQFPVQEGEDFHQIVDALRMVMYTFSKDGGKPTKEPIPDEYMERAKEVHNVLVEAAAEIDETLMEHYFDRGTLDEEELAEGLSMALANQSIYPLFCVSAEKNMGTGRVMGFIRDIAPSPAIRPAAILEDGSELEPNADDKTTVFIYKTISEPQVGKVSYYKVYSGVLKPGTELINTTHDHHERFNQIYESEGKERNAVDELIAGDLGATVKLKQSHSNDTLNEKGTSRLIEKMHFPDARIRTAVAPPGKGDIEKLSKALHVIQEEDPTLVVEHSAELKQLILHGQGQLHLDMVKHRIEDNYGINVDFIRPRIPYRETITKSADANYRHKKQSGGSGQFAEVHMRIEPYTEGMSKPSDLTVRSEETLDLPWGGKLNFLWCIVGGSIDAKYQNAIKKGLMMKMEEGPMTGSACRDIRVSVYDGKMHSVDSNDMAFQLASSACFKDAFERANPQVLEPLYKLEVLCDAEVMGEVMSDLQGRRAIILGIDSDGHYQRITAKVPYAEMYKYSSSLRSLTQGKAKFSRKFYDYEAMTPEQQRALKDKLAAE